MIDIIILAIVVGAALVGYLVGALRAIIVLGALVVTYLATRALMPGLVERLEGTVGDSPLVTVVLYAIVGLAVFVSASIAGRILNRRLGHTKRGDVRPWNRQLGALVGLVGGVVLGLIVLLGLDAYAAMLPQDAEGRLAHAVRGSRLRRAVAPHNPLRRYLVTDALQTLALARQDPRVLEDLREDPHIRNLMDHPKVQSAVQDEELRRAIESKDVRALMENENLREVYEDEELRDQIFSQETREALRRVRQRAAAREEDPPAEAPANQREP
jgi:uncharacterized membrane protein required for colicin V production